MTSVTTEKHRELDNVPGFLTWEEGQALLQWGATWPGEGIVVELGSLFGRSTVFLATGCRLRGKPQDEVWAIDHFQGSSEHQPGGSSHLPETEAKDSIYKKFKENIEEKGLSRYVQPVVMPHLEASGIVSNTIRILFIDGEHDYESTRANFEAWGPKVIPGGLILFHDDDKGHPEVQRLVSEISLQRLDNVYSIAAFKK